MLGKIILFFAIVIALTMAFHRSLQNGQFLRFLDEHPNPKSVPPTAYYVGTGLYIFHDLTEAATYFARVAERYPDSAYADDALYRQIQCFDDAPAIRREELTERYQAYADRFPNGRHIEFVRNRIDSLKTGAR